MMVCWLPLAELDTTMISPKAQFQLNEEQRGKTAGAEGGLR
jgi:hypothetical protein